MRNTRINYLYRDSENHKTWNHAIISGTMSPRQLSDVMNSLITGIYFIPSKVGLPEKKDQNSGDGPDWFELHKDGIKATDEPPNLDTDADTMASRFRKCTGKWFEMPDINAW